MTRAACFLLLPLAACASGPPTPEMAARQCRAEAPLADGIAGSIGVGASSGGPVGSGSLVVTNRVLDPQSEDDYIADCLDRELGRRIPPTTHAITAGRRP